MMQKALRARLAKLGGFTHGSPWECQRPKWLLGRVPTAIRYRESVASVGEAIDHGLKNELDFGQDEACLSKGIILRH